MKGRENRGPPPADLLVCFPSRAHLTLMPKPICSPARPSESNTHHRRRRRPHQPHLNKSSTRRGGGGSSNGGQGGTPLFWAKSKQMSGGDQEIAEPSSPKVTCAGQIKVRHQSSACRNWQSVMEEIERIHNNRKQRKKPNWAESLGFKKEIMQFLTCLRAVRFNFRCFGSFPAAVISSDEEEEEEDDDDEEGDEDEIYHGSHQLGTEGGEEKGGSSRTVFSKWFMVLDENQSSERKKFGDRERFSSGRDDYDDGLDNETSMPPPPPPNALLLMRCRSAPAKSWLEETEEEKEGKLEEESEKEEGKGKNIVEEETKEKKRESLAIVMRYDTDFYKLSTDIAEETWVVGGLKDPLSRSRSWKR